MKLDFRTDKRVNMQKQTPVVARDFSRLQKTQVDEDKIPFSEFSYVENMIHKGLNAVLRRGTDTLATIDDMLGIGWHDKDDETSLMAVIDTSSTTPNTSKLVEINRTTGAITDEITGITGNNEPDFTSLRQTLYVSNAESDIKLQDSTGTAGSDIVLPSSGIAKYITNDTERLWVAQTNGLIRFSTIESTDVATGNFVISGTDIKRAGLVQSLITNVTSLKSNGKLVCISDKDRMEIHQTPNFAQN